MAYQNVGTPRFYINRLEWLKENNSLYHAIELGHPPPDIWWHDIFRTLPVKTQNMTNVIKDQTEGYGSDEVGYVTNLMVGYHDHEFDLNQKQFVAALGVDWTTQLRLSLIGLAEGAGSAAQIDQGNLLVNAVGNDNYLFAQHGLINNENVPPSHYAGFSIALLTEGSIWIETPKMTGTFGSLIFGDYYDMPHSPDLSLTMTREYGGIKTMETKGGASLSNTYYTKPPKWGLLEAWELFIGDESWVTQNQNRSISRSGRRVWDLSFSYLQDSDVFPMMSSAYAYGSTSPTDQPYSDFADWYKDNTILNSDTFYGQVIHKTNGGQLPFIFQPDNTNNNPDQFAICKLDQKSIQFNQTAPGLYNVKLKIREVW